MKMRRVKSKPCFDFRFNHNCSAELAIPSTFDHFILQSFFKLGRTHILPPAAMQVPDNQGMTALPLKRTQEFHRLPAAIPECVFHNFKSHTAQADAFCPLLEKCRKNQWIGSIGDKNCNLFVGSHQLRIPAA